LGAQTHKSKKAPERLADFKKTRKTTIYWHKVNNVLFFYIYLHQQTETTNNKQQQKTTKS